MIKGEWQTDFKRLDDLAKALRNRTLRDAIRKANIPVKQALKASAPRLTGSLAVSMGQKQKTYKTGTTIGILGTKSKYQRAFKGRVIRPVKYLHLVTKGTIRARGNDYLERTLNSQRQAYIQTVSDLVLQELARFSK